MLEGILITLFLDAHRKAQAQVRKSFNQLEVTEAEIKDLTQALQRRIDELQALFNVIPVNIAFAEDPDCHVVKVNAAYAKLLQIPTDTNVAVTPKAKQSQLPYKFYQNGRELLGHELPVEYAAKHGVEVRDVEIELVRQDNAVFSLFGSAVPLFDESGQPRGSVGVYTNITERKQAEIALRESEERLRIANERFELAAKAVNCLIYDWNLESDRIERTDGLTKLFGYSLEEAEPTGQWWVDRIHPDDLQSIQDRALSVIAKEDNFSSEYRILNKSNQYVYVLDQCLVVARDPDGKPTRIVGSTIDISERKQAEFKLQESQRFIQQIADSIPGTLYVYDMQQQRNVYVNRQIGELLGYSPEQIQAFGDQLFAQLIYPEDFAAIGLQFERLNQAQEGEVIDYEYRMRHANGEWRWLWSRNTVSTRTADGLAHQVVGTVHDITDRKLAETEREQLLQREQAAREQAERANRVKDEFLAILSHELRSPLNPILGWAQLLQTRQFDAAKTAEALATIERNARLQSQLIDDLLDTAKILRGKLTLEIASVDLVVAIEAAMDTVRTAAVAKNILLHSVLPQIGRVLGDTNRLQQIVWNLLSNAVKFTPQNGRVDIQLARIGDRAQITVSDTGKGIKPDFLPYIFESFRQEDASTTRRFGGLGLGLAIVRQLVEAHGGTITAQSKGEGLGATFTVEFPLANLEVEPEQTEAVFEKEPDLSGMRVLVVDDEPDSRQLIVVILTQYGAEVMAVTSAVEVLNNLESFQPNVLVSDIGMPDVDGYSLIQQIRALPPEKGGQIPAIALTAYAREEDYQQAIANGYQWHITKPVNPEQLVKVVLTCQFR
ncbi:PAS domain-containing protein [Nostoc paludosum FACHB-159]|uniref:histidine kinase n=1 Tax=Nostoc paludosum FACHB-159 TaxID=2692908 RepID=A0ABR8KES8_9NOSO|nr:PAS domain-containing protein [Nostoc sp. FACHB-857]MBD2737251.1 PAS domain-containing protein [Nostoc paludosum FACHB-159]